MTIKSLSKILTAGLLCASLALCANAAFAKKNTYQGQFSDVAENSWYKNEVASAYELGFVKGTSNTLYSPNNTVTVAEAITMASRVHAEYNGKTIAETSGGKWYDAYVDYAKKNGIITDNQFDSFDREIKRFEMAEIFHDAMGKEYYNAINDVDFIPDVPLGARYMDKLLTLYNAGVVMGNDEYGSYNPDASIKRSECAAIINRVAIPENRIKKELSPFTSNNAYVLCYNVGMGGSKEDINSGWVYDNRGGGAKTDNSGATAVGDVSEKYGSCFIREFNYIPSGRLVLEISLAAINDGAYLEYLDIEGNAVYQLKIVDGKWNVLTKDGYASLGVDGGAANIRAVIDLDSGKSTTYINDKNCGTHDLLSDNILSFRIGMDEKGMGTVAISRVNMVVNYAVYDNFDIFGTDQVYGWTTSGSVAQGSLQTNFGTDSSAVKTFEPLSGKVCAETYFISKSGNDFEINLGDGLKLEGKNKKLLANGKELYNITTNMWYRLRVEADTDAGKADILLNGRSIGVVELTSNEPVSSLEFKSAGKSAGNFSIDDVKVYNLYEYSDYVPKPTTKANLDDFIVGLNICSLWRNGTHYGWACISAYDEPIPVIGMYDEGLPETADWEIKYMVEHGIDFQAFCWYADSNTAPLKNPSNSEHLHNGYMYAEYSDYMKYCILWEAANAAHFNSAYFRNCVIPYWFENYFLDPRYMTIDNQLVLPIFGSWQLATEEYFGTVAGVKAEFDYLEKKAKEYGFDGVLFFSCGSSSDQLAQMGFDASYAYNWGTAGNSLDVNKTSITKSAENTKMYTIPTISVGFDSIPWHGLRYGNMTVEDYGKGHEWVKDTYLPKYSPKYDWADNFMWLSTWNEYGEGTYIMPAGLNGFGYVDEVRKAYTDLGEEHEDIVPTLKQKERINHLYPQYAKLLRREGWYYYDISEKVVAAEPTNKLIINDIDVLDNSEPMYRIPPKVKNGKVYFPFNPSNATNFILGCHYEWRKDAGTLKIMANGHEVIFEVGADKYILDGEICDLGYTVEKFDGLPMLDFVRLAKDLDYKVEEKDGNVYIFTDTYEEIWTVISNRKTGVWEFDMDYDNEGFTSSSMNLIVSDGTMKMTTLGTTNDPISQFSASSFPNDFYTKKFTAVEIKCKYDYTTSDGKPSNISFYYITDLDENYGENKNLRIWLSDCSTNGEWVTLRYDLLSESNWQGADHLTGLRFDPFNGQGTMEIDYIRFIEDPDFAYIPTEERPIEVINGDAESDLAVFYSGNATITKEVDPDNKDNHVWKVQTREGENYTYFRYSTHFKKNMSYQVDFDIKLIGNNVGKPEPSATSFSVNFRYADRGAFNDFDHIVKTADRTEISVADGWAHCTATYTPLKIDDDEGSEFTIYLNPQDGAGFSYYLDNIVVKELGFGAIKQESSLVYDFEWDKADGKMLLDFEKEEDFTVGNAESEVKDGVLKLSVAPPKYDVTLTPNETNFSATEYSAVAVRFKADELDEASDPFVQVFFATDSDGDLSESKSVSIKYSALEVDDEGYMTAVINMKSNTSWKGKITKLRIDPANCAGTYYIDKVFLVKR